MSISSILRYVWLASLLASVPAWAGTARIYITNSAGDSIHVIDPATNKVVQVIKNVEGAHGVAFSPDGARVYVSDEADSTLDVFDRKSGKLIKKVPLSAHPNNIAVAKDGRIVVGIARDPGSRRWELTTVGQPDTETLELLTSKSWLVLIRLPDQSLMLQIQYCAIPNSPRHQGQPRMDEGRRPLDGDDAFINRMTNFKTIKIMHRVIRDIQETGYPGMSGKKTKMRSQHQNPCRG